MVLPFTKSNVGVPLVVSTSTFSENVTKKFIVWPVRKMPASTATSVIVGSVASRLKNVVLAGLVFPAVSVWIAETSIRPSPS